MGVDYYAYAILGVPLKVNQLFTSKEIRTPKCTCMKKTSPDIYCPVCGHKGEKIAYESSCIIIPNFDEDTNDIARDPNYCRTWAKDLDHNCQKEKNKCIKTDIFHHDVYLYPIHCMTRLCQYSEDSYRKDSPLSESEDTVLVGKRINFESNNGPIRDFKLNIREFDTHWAEYGTTLMNLLKPHDLFNIKDYDLYVFPYISY